MPIYNIGSQKILFIHIPKTAGMALHAHLSQYGPCVFDTRIKTSKGFFCPRHQESNTLEKIFFPEMIDYAFTIIRNPFQRIISEYRYQRDHPGIGLSRFCMLGFYPWLKYNLWRFSSNHGWRDGHFRPQVDYPGFKCEIFRLEDGLEQVMKTLSRKTNVNITQQISRVNISNPARVHVSKASLDLINKTYASDFRVFGYSSEPPAMKGVKFVD